MNGLRQAGAAYPVALVTVAPRPDELTKLFAAFDLTATYDKEQRAQRLAATLSPALIPTSQRPTAQGGGRGNLSWRGQDLNLRPPG
jgi:hypothetical protein